MADKVLNTMISIALVATVLGLLVFFLVSSDSRTFYECGGATLVIEGSEKNLDIADLERLCVEALDERKVSDGTR